MDETLKHGMKNGCIFPNFQTSQEAALYRSAASEHRAAAAGLAEAAAVVSHGAAAEAAAAAAMAAEAAAPGLGLGARAAAEIAEVVDEEMGSFTFGKSGKCCNCKFRFV